jgi:hypothetical protein
MKNTATELRSNFNEHKKQLDDQIYNSVVNPIIKSVDGVLDGYIGTSIDVSFVIQPAGLFNKWKSIDPTTYNQTVDAFISGPPLSSLSSQQYATEFLTKELLRECFCRVISSFKNNGFGVDYDEKVIERLLGLVEDHILFKIKLSW